VTLHAWLFVGLLVGMIAGYVHFTRSIWLAAMLVAVVPVVLVMAAAKARSGLR